VLLHPRAIEEVGGLLGLPKRNIPPSCAMLNFLTTEDGSHHSTDRKELPGGAPVQLSMYVETSMHVLTDRCHRKGSSPRLYHVVACSSRYSRAAMTTMTFITDAIVPMASEHNYAFLGTCRPFGSQAAGWEQPDPQLSGANKLYYNSKKNGKRNLGPYLHQFL
jgi:hypothetical protein